ncbi:MAG: sigma-70 family RNA polymerase sigma factor [Acidobacteriaceae bacterium]
MSSSSASSAHYAAEQETALVAAVLDGDRKATADFVALYSDPIYRYLRSRLFPRAELAEDLLQDVFLAAWSALSHFRGDAPLKLWLLGIARHKVEEHYRGRLRDSELYDNEEEPGPALEPDLDERLDQERLEQKMRAVLAALPEAYRTVLLWRYWEARSTREIAEMTNKTEKAIERLLARARAHFKLRWNHE